MQEGKAAVPSASPRPAVGRFEDSSSAWLPRATIELLRRVVQLDTGARDLGVDLMGDPIVQGSGRVQDEAALALVVVIADKVSAQTIGRHRRQQGLAVVEVDRDRRLGLLGIPSPTFDPLTADAVEPAGGRRRDGLRGGSVRRVDVWGWRHVRLCRPKQCAVALVLDDAA